MKRENIFYFIFILTILATRLEVFLFPREKIIINGTIVHHLWIGIFLILFVLLLSKRYFKLRMTIFSIGSALIADELIYIIFGGKTVSEYWSPYSIFGATVMATVIFIIRDKLIIKI